MTINQTRIDLTQNILRTSLTNKVIEVLREPEYHWAGDFTSFMTDSADQPVIRLAVANCAIDMNIWEGLRSPAVVGMFPLTFSDIWMHYAASRVETTRADGSANPLAMPETFEFARQRYRRAVLISGMLAINPAIYQRYAEKIELGDPDPYDYFSRSQGEVIQIINKSISKFALSLMAPNRAVIPMNKQNAEKIIDRTRSEYQRGGYHGPCNDHWPQNSLAVMTGLLRFGVSRLPFRDEILPNGKRQRLFGRYASIVIFDDQLPHSNDIVMLDQERIQKLRLISDYGQTTPEAMAGRYCSYNNTRPDGTSICGKCLQVCPSLALPNSSPLPNGKMPDQLKKQLHRFDAGTLDFDYANCCRDRDQKTQLYDEYFCARCEVICAARGIIKSVAQLEKIT